MARNIETTINRVNALLEAERRALAEGRLDTLAGLAERKRELIEQLEGLDRAQIGNLQQMREKALRNERLLQSALDGIRAVADRIAVLRQVRAGLETYDSNGRKNRIGSNADPSLEKRA